MTCLLCAKTVYFLRIQSISQRSIREYDCTFADSPPPPKFKGQRIMSIIKEFKEFAAKGNVMDMAVGIVIGAAFGKIVSSFVADIIMPPVGVLISGVDFSDLVITIKQATATYPAVVLAYGKFIQSLIDFAIIAVAIFLVVKGLNSLKRKEAVQPPPVPLEPPVQEVLLREIRDLLKEKSTVADDRGHD